MHGCLHLLFARSAIFAQLSLPVPPATHQLSSIIVIFYGPSFSYCLPAVRPQTIGIFGRVSPLIFSCLVAAADGAQNVADSVISPSPTMAAFLSEVERFAQA